MVDHIVDGQFKSDKYEWCPPGFVPLKIGDPMATDLLEEYARRRVVVDVDFSTDLAACLLDAPRPIEYEPVRRVLMERWRQLVTEGWSEEHDDGHTKGELARAAACYASGALLRKPSNTKLWPWDLRWWKPKDRVRNLEKAGALILAELGRLLRLREKHRG